MNRLHINKNFTFKRAKRNIKRAWRKLKYLDRTQVNYFLVTGFIGLFCLSTALSYATFAVSNTILNAVTIRVAKLNYTLQGLGNVENGTVNCENESCTVTVPANSKTIANFKITSLNPINTKYAVRYLTKGDNTNIYYSQNLSYNLEGTIGMSGSEIIVRLVFDNQNSSSSEQSSISITGGYIQNTLTSNITEGYYEKDLTIRTILMDQNFNITDTTQSSFPAKNSGYVYFKTVCSEDANPVWSNDDWAITINQLTEQVSCDVYFKQLSTQKDLEIVYRVIDSTGSETYVTDAPTSLDYGYLGTTCSPSASAKWNRSTAELTVSGVEEHTLCVATFKYGENDVAESPIKCLTESGAQMTCPSADALQVGQRIAIGDQVFRYIRTTDTSDTTTQLNECADGSASIACSDGDARHPLADGQLRLLAEYNLMVGNYCTSSSSCPEMNQTDLSAGTYGTDVQNETIGLQSPYAIGYPSVGSYPRYGTLAYGASNSSYNGSNVKTAIETYANTLNTTYFNGENTVSGSALTKAELENLECDSSSNSCSSSSYPWVYSTSFWSGSAYNNYDVWFVLSTGSFDLSRYDFNDYFGARAVISISESSI